jgi:hypothetical protein
LRANDIGLAILNIRIWLTHQIRKISLVIFLAAQEAAFVRSNES